MKITDIRMLVVTIPLSRAFWMSYRPITKLTESIIHVHTDEGLIGLGPARGKIDMMRQILAEFRHFLLGEDPLNTERLWQRMFATTYSRTRSGFPDMAHAPDIMRAVLNTMAGVDNALWDIKGKAAGLPLYKLLGGHRDRIPAYTTCGYYQEGGGTEEFVEDVRRNVEEHGYWAVKVKLGGMPLREDVCRLAALRAALPEVQIHVDVNQVYDVPTAIEAARAFAQFDLAWYEDPVRWYDDIKGLGKVAAASPIPIAAGYYQNTLYEIRNLLEAADIKVVQYDALRVGGVTEWLKVAALAEAHGVLISDHHGRQVHNHLAAAVPNSTIVEGIGDPARGPIFYELYSGYPAAVEGWIDLPQGPGFDIQLDDHAIKKYGQWLD